MHHNAQCYMQPRANYKEKQDKCHTQYAYPIEPCDHNFTTRDHETMCKDY